MWWLTGCGIIFGVCLFRTFSEVNLLNDMSRNNGTENGVVFLVESFPSAILYNVSFI